jgi:hypothetical protein
VPVVPLRPVPGDQVYVVAPLAVSVVLVPSHIVAGGTLITGLGFTVTTTVIVLVQPAADVPVTVYVVVVAGLAVTDVPVVPLSPVPGSQVYVDAPVGVNVADVPSHIVAAGTVTTGIGLTVTITVEVLVQPAADVPVTV